MTLASGEILSWSPGLASGTIALTRIDPETGAHRVTRLDASTPNDVIEDPDGNYLLALPGSIARFEVATGILGILASGGLTEPSGLAVDPTTGEIFAAEAFSGKVWRLSPGSPLETFAEGDLLDEPTALALALDGDLLVGDGNRVIRIDRATRAQSLHVEFGVPLSSPVADLAVDAAGEALVLQVDLPRCAGQSFDYALRRVPIAGGSFSDVLCGSRDDPVLPNVKTVSLDANGADLVMLGSAGQVLVKLDAQDGSLEVISQFFRGGPAAFDAQGRLFAARGSGSTRAEARIFEVDPRTGVELREVASGGFLDAVHSLRVAEGGDSLFVLDRLGLVRVDLVTGARARVVDLPETNAHRKLRGGRDGQLLISSPPLRVDPESFETTPIPVVLQGIRDVADPGSGEIFFLGIEDVVALDPDTGGQRSIGASFAGFPPDAMLPEPGGTLLASVSGGTNSGLVRIDPSDGSSSLVAELPLQPLGDVLIPVVVPEPAVGLGAAAALGALAILARRRSSGRLA